MALFTIIKISSCIYLISSVLKPNEIINLTAEFLSLLLDQPVNHSQIITHVAKSIVLLIGFVISYTFIGAHAIFTLIKQNTSQKTIEIKNKPKKSIAKSHSIPLESTNITDNTAVPVAAVVGSIEKENTHSPPIESVPVKSSQETSSFAKEKVELPVVVNNVASTTSPTNKKSDDDIIGAQSLEIEAFHQNNRDVNNDAIIIEQSAVKPILAQDQMTETLTSLNPIQHVIANNNESSREMEQSKKKSEVIVPPSSQYQDELEPISTATTSATVTPPAEPATSLDSKEEYYKNIIKKDSDIKSFSDSVKNIFDGPPTAFPLIEKTEPFIIYSPTSNEDILDNKPASIHQSIEEMTFTNTPALTPQAGSTSSRRSSTTSNNTSKSRLQTAIQKMSGPRQPPKQQTMDSPIVMDTSNSSSSLNKSKSRFSSIRLTRKKSTNSVANQPQKNVEALAPPKLEVKPSTSTSKLNNKLKKTTKRLSKLFS